MHTVASSELHKHARHLADIGMAVFPCLPGEKRPAVEWRDWATTDQDKIDGYWQAHPDANIGVATGTPSNLVVVDIDDPDKWDSLELPMPTTLRSDTGKGYHLWFRPPNGRELRNTVRPEYGFDIRGDGGYVVAPPSHHPDGDRYRWNGWNDPAPFPQKILTLLDEKKADTAPARTPVTGDRARKFGQAVLEREITRVLDAMEGGRNHTLFEVACNIFEVVKGGYVEESTARGQLTAAGQTVGLPLDEIEYVLGQAWDRTDERHPADGPIDEPDYRQLPPDAGAATLPSGDERIIEVRARRDPDDPVVRGNGTGLRYIGLDDLDDLPQLRFLLEDRLPEGQTWMAGAPGAGKSFIALDWASTYTAITHEPVLYYVGEGLAGMAGRIKAWRQAHPHVRIDNMQLVAGCPQLAQGPGPIAADWDAQGLSPRLVVIDTFARAAVGVDENSSQEVGRTIHTMGELQERYGCSFLILHHTNASGTKTRGSTAIDGAAESIWMVQGDDNDPHSYMLSCKKLKDGARPRPEPGRRVQYGPSVAVMPSALDQLGYGQAP